MGHRHVLRESLQRPPQHHARYHHHDPQTHTVQPVCHLCVGRAMHPLLCAEGIIFIYLGMDSLDPAKWRAAHPGEPQRCITLRSGPLQSLIE